MTNATYKTTIEALVTRSKMSDGAAKDLAKCIDTKNLQYGFTETTLAKGDSLGIDFLTVWALPQKQIFRLVQLVNALVSGNRLHLDYTHARILCAMRLAGEHDLNTDALTHLAAGSRVTGNANLRGITSSAVNAMFAQSHSLTTVATKVSNMTGKNGFSQVLGMTFAEPGKQNHTIAMNSDSPIVQSFFKLIDTSTLGQIEAMNDKGISQ